MDVLRVRTLLLGGPDRAHGRLGRVLDRAAPAPRRPSPTPRGRRHPRHPVHRRDRAVRVRRGAAGPVLPVPRRDDPAGDGCRHRAARGGADRDPRQPELALQLVGMAPPAAGGVPDHRARRAQRVPAARLADRRVRRAVPGGHACAVDRWYAGAVASVAAAQAAGSGTDDVLAELRREGATDQELTLLSQTAREVSRLDASFRPYLPSVVTERIRRRATSSPVATIGDERVVTAMFADLAGTRPSASATSRARSWRC